MKSFYFAFVLTLITNSLYAAQGRGGGDVACEDRIKVIRDDLQTWINNGGPNGLSLSAGLSVADYSKQMLAEISVAKIRCVGQGDPGYPVEINGTPKVCRFDKDSSGSLITCDFIKINATKDSDQYVQVHHEYAGLAGIEIPNTPNGDDSDYRISNQITGYLVEQVVKKLAVKPLPQIGDIETDKGGNVIALQWFDALDYCVNLGMRLPTAREFAQLSTGLGAKGIKELSEFANESEAETAGYTLVKARSLADGKIDSFYYNGNGYKPPRGVIRQNWFWSSSIAVITSDSLHRDVAYVHNGLNGDVEPNPYPAYTNLSYAVRCVTSP